MTTTTNLEAQVVYFALKNIFRSGIVAEKWSYVCIPITMNHLQKSTPTLPDNYTENFDETMRQFLGFLSGLYDQGGDMEGWYDSFVVCAFLHANGFFPSYRKAHSIEGPAGDKSTDGVRARVIQVRELYEHFEEPK